jgi:hypothetical protein
VNKAAQIIVTPAGERLAVLPEEDYLMLLAASEDDEGELSPGFITQLERRRRAISEGGALVPRATPNVYRATSNVYIEARPKGRQEGTPIEDYVIEDDEDHVLKTFKTQKEAIDWARKEGRHPLVARVRHENNKSKPDHWRSA